MSRKISITAVIPTIGNNDFLINSINSIINQKKPFNEIIVFDNSQDKELKKSIEQVKLQTKYFEVFYSPIFSLEGSLNPRIFLENFLS